VILARCPSCQSTLQVADQYAGKVIACGKCKQQMRLPAVAPAPAPPPAAPTSPPPVAPPPVLSVLPAVKPAPPAAPELPPVAPGDEPPRPTAGQLSPEEERLLDRLPIDRVPDELRPELAQLGKPLTTVRLRGFLHFLLRAAPCLGIGLILLLLVFGVGSGAGTQITGQTHTETHTYTTTRRSGEGGALFGLVLGTVLLGVGGVFLYLGFRHRGGTLWVCREGLLWIRGGRRDRCSWEQVPAFYEEKVEYPGISPVVRWLALGSIDPEGVKYLGALELPGGDTVNLTSRATPLARFCGQLINRRLARTLLPLHRQSLQNGEALDFGPLRLTRAELRQGDRRLPWSEIRGVETRDRDVVVRPGRAGDPIIVRSGTVPFLAALLPLSRELLAEKGAAVVPGH